MSADIQKSQLAHRREGELPSLQLVSSKVRIVTEAPKSQPPGEEIFVKNLLAFEKGGYE